MINMVKSLEYVLISDFGDIRTGKTPKTENTEYWNGNVPFITPTDIPGFDSKKLLHTERTISEEGVRSQKNTLLPPNSLCVSCIATIGKLCLTSVPSITNQQINSIIVNNNYNPDYLFYVFRYYLPYLQLIGGGTGSGTPIINKNKFSKLKYPIFKDKKHQAKIANVLSNYDQLIENNNKRIRLLESIAKELYKEWFVRFRFPDHEKYKNKESELGKIPSSFSVIKANDIFSYFVGGGWGNDNITDEYSEPAYVIRGADFPYITRGDVSTCPYRFHKISNYKPRKLRENDIVFEISGGTAKQPVGRTVIVTKGILERLENKVICASFCKLLRPDYNKITPYYFYHYLQFLYDTRMIERFQLQSTGIINFKFEYFLRKGPILIPPKTLMEEFDRHIKPMMDEIDDLAKKNVLLARQRDSMLPRLMSGKLSVEGKEVI